MSDTAEPAARENPQVTPANRRSLVPRIGVAAVALVAVVGASLSWWQVERGHAAVDHQVEARAAAEQVMVDLLTYDHTSVDTDLSEALTGVTGPFADDYRTLVDEVIVPVARERQISTTAHVVRSGIAGSDGDTVTVLLFMDQTTTSVDEPGTRRDSSRVQVSLRQVDGRWKVDQVQSV